MDDTTDISLVFCLDGENISAVTDSNNVVHKGFLNVRRTHHFVKALSYAHACLSNFPPDICKLRTGCIGNFVLGENCILYFIFKPLVGRKLLKKRVKHGLNLSAGGVVIGKPTNLFEH